MAAIGEPIGAFIVDRSHEQGPPVVVVAGDSRWQGVEEQCCNGSGDILGHLVMPAIGMIANKPCMF